MRKPRPHNNEENCQSLRLIISMTLVLSTSSYLLHINLFASVVEIVFLALLQPISSWSMFSSSIPTSLTRLFTFSAIVSSILPSENSKIITDSLTVVAKEASVNQKEDILLYSPINKLYLKE